MTIWVLRFAPYEGGATVDAYFHSEMRAKALFKGFRESDVNVDFTDDFGIMASYDPSRGMLILTNTDSSAQFNKALNDANSDAARMHGIAPRPWVKGSTVQ